jgi:hypothetical protein
MMDSKREHEVLKHSEQVEKKTQRVGLLNRYLKYLEDDPDSSLHIRSGRESVTTQWDLALSEENTKVVKTFIANIIREEKYELLKELEKKFTGN